MRRNFFKSVLILLVALAILGMACALVFTLSANVAYAETVSKTVIKAMVSNLEGNEFAAASAVRVLEQDGTRKFFMPESYFLVVEGHVADSYYSVEYAGAKFYVAMNDLALVPSEENFDADEVLSPDVKLTLAEGVDVASIEGMDAQLKKMDPSYEIKFLGYGENDQEGLIYIMATPAEGKSIFGFIPASAFEEFHVPYQARAQAERDELIAQKEALQPAPGPGDLPAPTGSLALKIILIIGISLPALIIVILLFVPSSRGSYVRKTRGASSDGRDYDDPNGRGSRSDRLPYDDPNSYGGGRNAQDRRPANYGNPPANYGNPPTNGQDYYPPQGPANGQGYYPPQAPNYGDGRGYDPRRDREVRGYDQNDYGDRR